MDQGAAEKYDYPKRNGFKSGSKTRTDVSPKASTSKERKSGNKSIFY